MRISDLITAAGSLREGAQGHMADLTRIVKSSTGERSFQHIPVRLEDILTGNTEANLLLQGHDSLTINTDPRWSQPHTVEITGEVKYPGIYPIARGEQLSSLIKRAGGITDIAFPDGAFLSRPSVAEREASEMRTLADAIERGMKATILERADETLRPGESLSVATDVIELLRGVEPPGRVVIDLPKILDESAGGGVSDADVLLLADDKINIPEFRQVISVIGEVNYPATHTFIDDASVSDYIEMSGGLTSKTREKLVYVVHANGTASLKTSRRGNNGINPGDTIVVPLDVEKIRSLKQWTEISSIFGNIVNPAASVVSAAALWKAAEAEVRKAEALEKSLENTRPLPVID
jgi:protein involved in polysaccharide export with SLBB domain